MWQRFTERARKAVFYAQEEAQRFGEGYVSTEHLLLGLLREADSSAHRILTGVGVDPELIKAECIRHLPSSNARPSQDMTLTPRAKRVIDLAYDEARNLDNNWIGTEHLLMGLVREGEGMAGRVLARFGVKLENARTVVRALQENQPIPPVPPPTPIEVKDEKAYYAPANPERPPTSRSTGAGSGRMWHEFSDSARKVIFFAMEEAQRREEISVDPQFLLLGLLHEERGSAWVTLVKAGYDPAAIKAAVEGELPGPLPRPGLDQFLSPRSKKVIDFAFAEASEAGRDHIGAGDLLLGLLRDDNGIASEVLRRLNIELDQVRLHVAG